MEWIIEIILFPEASSEIPEVGWKMVEELKRAMSLNQMQGLILNIVGERLIYGEIDREPLLIYV